MTCPTDDVLSRILVDEATAAERAVVETHARECPTCASLLAASAAVVRCMTELGTVGTDEDYWPGFRDRVMARLATQEPCRTTVEPRARRPAWRLVLSGLRPALATAAIALWCLTCQHDQPVLNVGTAIGPGGWKGEQRQELDANEERRSHDAEQRSAGPVALRSFVATDEGGAELMALQFDAGPVKVYWVFSTDDF